MFGTLLDRASTEVFGGAISLAELWTIRSNVRDVVSLPWFDTSAGYPFGGTLAWGENLLLPSAILSPLIISGVPPVLAYNLLLILLTALNGWCAFRLVYQLTGSAPAAFLSGVAWMTAPVFTGPHTTLSMSCMCILPLAISATLRLIASQGFPAAVMLGALYALAAFTSTTLTIVTLVCTALLFVCGTVVHPDRWRATKVWPIVLGVCLGAVPALAIVLPSAVTRDALTPLSAEIVLARSGTLRSFAPLHPLHLTSLTERIPTSIDISIGWVLLLGSILAVRRLSDSRSLLILLLLAGLSAGASAALSLGASTLSAVFGWVAIAASLVLLYRLGALERTLNVRIVTNRDFIAIFFCLGLFFLLFSLGPTETFSQGRGIPSVFTAAQLFHWGVFPLGSPAVGGIVVALALSVIGAFTVARLLRRSPAPLWIVPAIGICLVAENYRIPPTTPLPAPANFERYLETAANEGGSLVALPLAEPGATDASFLTATFPLRRATLNRHTERTTVFFTDLATTTRDFPSSRSIRALAAIVGLRYILIRGGNDIVTAAAPFADSIRYLESDGDGNYLFEFMPETNLRSDFSLYTPSRSSGLLSVHLRALYETGEPHIPIALEWNDNGTWRQFSEAVVTANGEWAEFSFPLPRQTRSPHPLEIRFVVPERSRLAIRRTGFIARQ